MTLRFGEQTISVQKYVKVGDVVYWKEKEPPPNPGETEIEMSGVVEELLDGHLIVKQSGGKRRIKDSYNIYLKG